MPDKMDWDSVNVIEFNGSKGWEIHSWYEGIIDATIAFRDLVVNDREDMQWRLTTAKP